jgi:transcription elongation GreA/GreB family factor
VSTQLKNHAYEVLAKERERIFKEVQHAKDQIRLQENTLDMSKRRLQSLRSDLASIAAVIGNATEPGPTPLEAERERIGCWSDNAT